MATARQLEHTKTDLYEHDFLAWTEEQAQALREKQAGRLDWGNLLEEIESMGASQKQEIRNRLRVLLMHLIMWHFQSEKHTPSWQSTIAVQRHDIEDVLEDSPSLRRLIPEMLPKAWTRARLEASLETQLPMDNFPVECPWAIDDVLDADWWPE